MKILIVGYFTQISKSNIKKYFPNDWDIVIVPPGKEMLHHIGDCQVIIPEHIKVDRDLLSMAKKLKLVQTGAGYDNVDIDACTQLGIWVANAAGVNAQAVAEHVMALMLSYYKNIPYLDRFMKTRTDEKQLDYTGSELKGKTIGIIGFGAVGKKVAEFCRVFDMDVLVNARHAVVQPDSFVKMTDFDNLLSVSDIVTVHTSLNPQTKQLIDKGVFKKMKNTALFINTARGGIVNENDLIAALKDKEISGACLDVFESEPLSIDSELRNLSNVILTPHTAGMPDGVKLHKKRYDFFVNNIKHVKNGEEPESKLNQVL
ncbi:MULTISPECIES: NAD(P)-dependent oxidoreductase [Paenibacillus]|jgi:D-3-phosphoglycerate dehydrogenase|uniref:NAD(P)-dependent oxidoreductase n=1 Tax=Paenibacillus TaxID=44249 RepID=UPI000410CEB1|nr:MULTISPECIES: NAD(P)-dependent oxidoreductase [Paenibacillus]UMY55166.1 phosphoglycerate dehydrogenase [Paenibacillus peoriae]